MTCKPDTQIHRGSLTSLNAAVENYQTKPGETSTGTKKPPKNLKTEDEVRKHQTKGLVHEVIDNFSQVRGKVLYFAFFSVIIFNIYQTNDQKS